MSYITPICKDFDPAQACNYRPISFCPKFWKELYIMKCLLSFTLAPSYLTASLVIVLLVLHRKLFSMSHTTACHKPLDKRVSTAVIFFLTSLKHLIMFHICYLSSIFIKLVLPAFFIIGLRTTFQQEKNCVILNGQTSSPQVISSGVSQGSILGPLLFTIWLIQSPFIKVN